MKTANTRSKCLAALLTLFGCAGAAMAQLPFPDIASSERWIDGPDGVQPGTTKEFPAVAVDEEGRRIHVWGANLGGVEGVEIFLRRFDAEGNPLGNTASPTGDPVQVNTTTEGLQSNPRIAVSSDGSFLVVFDSRELIVDPPNPDVLRMLVRCRAYGANGDPLGPEQLVTLQHTGTVNPTYVDVAALRTSDGSPGGYAVVWITHDSVGTDPTRSVQGCLVGSTGVPGSVFQINSTQVNQDWSSVTELADGGFLAIWSTNNQVWGRRFNGAGGPIGNDFQISTTATTQVVEKDAAIGWGGRVAIVWSGDEGIDGREIRARLYDSDLAPLGSDFRVNTVTVDYQLYPRVADYGPAGFLVVWQSEQPSGASLGDSIEARLVTGVDEFAGSQVQYNVYNDASHNSPETHGWYGRLATDWTTPSWDGDPSPINNNAGFVIGRDVEYCIFCDDLEWGSTWRWSVSVP